MELRGKKITVVDVAGGDDFDEAYFSYAEYEDGTELTQSELEELTALYKEEAEEASYSDFL